MNRTTLCFTPIVFLLVAAPATGSAFQEEIELAIQTELEQSGVPSLQVAIGRAGEVIYEGAFGFADLEQDVVASTETRYRSASISKWLTATAAMKLVEQGKLDLDKSIQEYCPHFAQKRWPITARHLLTHTSGIRGYADYEAEFAEASSDEERADIKRRQNLDALGTYTRYTDVVTPLSNFKNDSLIFEPGTDWLYTSFGYRVLACVIEGASGQTYRSLLNTEVLEPAGLTGTVPDDSWAIVPHRAAGYRLNRGEPIRRADMRDVSENLPAGGHLTTATDLVRFAQAFQAGQLVSQEAVSLMTQGLSGKGVETENYTSWRHAIPSREKYAYGIMSFPNETQLWIGHTGRQAGASSIVVLVPEQDISIAVLTNVKGWGGYLSLVREIHTIIARDTAVVNRSATAEEGENMARVTGIGGVFFLSQGEGKVLSSWYEEHLGMQLEGFGAAILKWEDDNAEDKGLTVWHVANRDSDWFSPSESAFMINYRVDDLEAMVEQLTAAGIDILQGPEYHENGAFAWIMDPEGNKIELWEPKIWDEKNKK